jgi:phosphoribosylformylglycinamidine synthase
VKATVTVSLKDGVLDPQGKAVEHALHNLGFSNVAEVRVGKVINFSIDAADEAAARAQAEEMGRKLLANTVIERFDVQVRP